MTSGARAGATKPRLVRGFVLFKWAIYSLLAANVALYATSGTPTEAIDTAAWVLLLLLFEWETGGWRLPRWSRPLLRLLRALAALAVVWAFVDYALDGERLDFLNAITWLAVVLALELELRIPAALARVHRMRRVLAWCLYTALAGFALAWWLQAGAGLDEAWLDAWDASLWLAAFVAIELNVFGLAGAAPGTERAATSQRAGADPS
ncbi:hypothetical protein E4582_00140 [Luteimonas yindakuii]|uniref:Uncharacterized protein n=1 Tax=Luteimonas yindakuii TaxID=2565782 RepID=A0A4Z1RI66_9GAMM|nr:hypothetical protein [Luteimonas yindakuii]TKS53331.1 hypothetical protein E4582_00140 [Luteimonas yindakuii]